MRLMIKIMLFITLFAPCAYAEVVVLSYITGNTPNVNVSRNNETLIWNFEVFPPGSPLYSTSHDILAPWRDRPIACKPPVDAGKCPDAWAVLVHPTPVTVYNPSPFENAEVVVNIYSDNNYIYQFIETVEAGRYRTLSIQPVSLGYLLNSLPDVSMPVKISVTSTAPVEVIRNTQRPSAFQQGALRVWGAMVELLPMQ